MGREDEQAMTWLEIVKWLSVAFSVVSALLL